MTATIPDLLTQISKKYAPILLTCQQDILALSKVIHVEKKEFIGSS